MSKKEEHVLSENANNFVFGISSTAMEEIFYTNKHIEAFLESWGLLDEKEGILAKLKELEVKIISEDE